MSSDDHNRLPIPKRQLAGASTGALLTCTLLLASCMPHLGPGAVPKARFDYNRAVAVSWDQQLLLNLVRLRYRDTPHFLDLGSVVAQYSASGRASVSPLLIEGGDGELDLGAGVDVSESPSLTFTPLQGEEFVRRLLSPLSAQDLVLLSQSGWSISRLFDCCVEQIQTAVAGSLENAPRAAGPTPEVLYASEWVEFRRMAEDLRRLQVAGALRAVFESPGSAGGAEGEGSAGTEARVFLAIDQGALERWEGGTEERVEAERALERVRRLLGPPGSDGRYRLLSGRGTPGPGQALISGRSLLEVLFYLSQTVVVPEEHRRRGLVTETSFRGSTARVPAAARGGEPSGGGDLDWWQISGRLLHVCSGTSTADGGEAGGSRTVQGPHRPACDDPGRAAVKVRYRGHWFWIDDTDLQSKSTFLLLSQLFSLQASSGEAVSPLLTLSTGR